jgi:hypothetical protein
LSITLLRLIGLLRVLKFFLHETPGAKVVEQLDSRPVQPGLHCPNRPFYCQSDFLITLTGFVKQHKYFPVIFPQSIDRRTNLGSKLGRIIGGSVVGRLMEVIDKFWDFRPAAEPRPTAVYRDPQNPRPQWTRGIPAFQAPKYAEKYLLRNILGILRVTENPVTDSENVALEPLDHFPASSRFSRQTAANQSGIGCHIDLLKCLPHQRQGSFNTKRSSFQYLVYFCIKRSILPERS